jgi:DNA-binding NarL/FixJ family response regulator
MGDVLTEMTRGRDNKKADPESAKITKLTEREREIIVLIAEGLKNKQIAERMFISETTVRHHLTSVFNKLSVADRLELMIYAFRHKLVAPAH